MCARAVVRTSNVDVIAAVRVLACGQPLVAAEYGQTAFLRKKLGLLRSFMPGPCCCCLRSALRLYRILSPSTLPPEPGGPGIAAACFCCCARDLSLLGDVLRTRTSSGSERRKSASHP